MIGKLLEKEMHGCFRFFWEKANQDLDSHGYGIILDSTRGRPKGTVAGIGFALGAYVVGVEKGYIDKDNAYSRVLGTLVTLRDHIPHRHGFWAHFLDMNTGERFKSSHDGTPTEFSTIDTAIALMGVIVVKEYFGGEIGKIASELLERTDWEWLVAEENGRKHFRMAYNQEDSHYVDGWSKSKWDHYAEQLMMYFLYAAKPDADPKLAKDLYMDFERGLGQFQSPNYVYCFGNALFIHQFSHAFIDFGKILDMKNFDWFENSVSATIANMNFCKTLPFETYKQGFWGLTAMHSETGYTVLGAPPYGYKVYDFRMKGINGLVAPYASLSSIIFTPKAVFEQMAKFGKHPELWGDYGLYDSFNLESDFVSNSYLAIDKGPTILMLSNQENGLIHKLVMNSQEIRKAIGTLGFSYRSREE